MLDNTKHFGDGDDEPINSFDNAVNDDKENSLFEDDDFDDDEDDEDFDDDDEEDYEDMDGDVVGGEGDIGEQLELSYEDN